MHNFVDDANTGLFRYALQLEATPCQSDCTICEAMGDADNLRLQHSVPLYPLWSTTHQGGHTDVVSEPPARFPELASRNNHLSAIAIASDCDKRHEKLHRERTQLGLMYRLHENPSSACAEQGP